MLVVIQRPQLSPDSSVARAVGRRHDIASQRGSWELGRLFSHGVVVQLNCPLCIRNDGTTSPGLPRTT